MEYILSDCIDIVSSIPVQFDQLENTYYAALEEIQNEEQ